MNQDAQIFNDNQECLNEQYLASKVPTKKEEAESHSVHNTEVKEQPPKKESLNYAHPRFTMSIFQLYETKTVKKNKNILCKIFTYKTW